ncbi:MAG: hypothetical protein QM758_18520 [Armatimonas sp.]
MNQQNPNESASEKLAAFEKEKMSRRNALSRFGFLAGAAAVAALTSDELLRKVGDKLSQSSGDNKVAQQVAREFQAAGVALASPSDDITGCSGCISPCNGGSFQKCVACGDTSNNYCDGKQRKVDRPCSEVGELFGRDRCKECCEARNPNNPVGANYCIGYSQCWGYS